MERIADNFSKAPQVVQFTASALGSGVSHMSRQEPNNIRGLIKQLGARLVRANPLVCSSPVLDPEHIANRLVSVGRSFAVCDELGRLNHIPDRWAVHELRFCPETCASEQELFARAHSGTHKFECSNDPNGRKPFLLCYRSVH